MESILYFPSALSCLSSYSESVDLGYSSPGHFEIQTYIDVGTCHTKRPDPWIWDITNANSPWIWDIIKRVSSYIRIINRKYNNKVFYIKERHADLYPLPHPTTNAQILQIFACGGLIFALSFAIICLKKRNITKGG